MEAVKSLQLAAAALGIQTNQLKVEGENYSAKEKIPWLNPSSIGG
jgi:hypothetical protein